MKANKANLLQFLYRCGHLEIPVYQRAYSWSLRECQQLWDGIIRLVQSNSVSSHFMGSIIYVEKDVNQISLTNTFQLIDGGQRLITVSLLLAAISQLLDISSKNEYLKAKIACYLFNPDEEEDLHIKLGLNQEDKDTFAAIVECKDNLPRNYSARIFENFGFFLNAIQESDVAPEQILESLKKLEIIDIALQSNIDDPQAIFNSLNSTGLQLSEIDQIRNTLLVNLSRSEQKEVYKDYWIPMEQMFKETSNSTLIQRFIRDYLTIQNNGEIPERLYPAFQKFFNERSKHQSGKDIVRHLCLYSRYFIKLIFADENDPQIKEAIKKLNSMKSQDAYPFLLEVYDDYENGLIGKNIFLDILKSVENYLLSGVINISGSQNAIFTNLSQEVNQMLAFKTISPPDDSEKLVEAVNKKRASERTINTILENQETKDFVSNPFSPRFGENDFGKDQVVTADRSKALQQA